MATRFAITAAPLLAGCAGNISDWPLAIGALIAGAVGIALVSRTAFNAARAFIAGRVLLPLARDPARQAAFFSDDPTQLREAFRHYLNEITGRKGVCETRRTELTEFAARLSGMEAKIIATFGVDAVELDDVRAKSANVATEIEEQTATITEGERILTVDVPQTQTLMEGVVTELEAAYRKSLTAAELRREFKELSIKAQSSVKASAEERARLDDLLGRFARFASYLRDRRSKLDADAEVGRIGQDLQTDLAADADSPRHGEPALAASRRPESMIAVHEGFRLDIGR